MKKKLLVVILLLIATCCLVISCSVGFISIYRPVQVEGSSMYPNYKSGELHFVNLLSNDFSVGDVVVINKNNVRTLKRIIAKEGDSVVVREGSVFVNGSELNETKYGIKSGTTTAKDFIEEGIEVVVPARSFFVLGDNRKESLDSRSSKIGFVMVSEIEGKIM